MTRIQTALPAAAAIRVDVVSRCPDSASLGDDRSDGGSGIACEWPIGPAAARYRRAGRDDIRAVNR